VDDIEATGVLLALNNDTRPAHVTTTGDYNDITGIELDEIGDLVLLDIEFDGVVDLDVRVGVADSSPVVRDDVWDALSTDGHFAYLEKLVASLLRCDPVDGETTLNVVKKTEVFTRLFNGDNIWEIHMLISFLGSRGLEYPKDHTHETSGVGRVRPDLPVNLD